VIVNPYSVVAAFVSFVEAALGAATLGIAIAAIRRRAAGHDPTADRRYHLLILLSATLLGLAVAAWPLFYLVLASYVPRWPGVMCVQGVERVGTGAMGATGSLPTVLATLEFLRPAAVFVAGAWLVLHVANRRTRTAPLTGGVVVLLATAGAFSLACGAVEAAYLLIPKEANYLADGCCTIPSDWTNDGAAVGPLVARFGEDGARRAATALFFGVGAPIAGVVAWALLRKGDALERRTALAAAAFGGFGFLAAASAFATDAASPVLLRLPHHRCAWCLFASIPESLIGAALVFLGVFTCGWAALAAWSAPGEDGRAEMERQVRTLLRASLFGYLGALLLAAVELATA
jgi:hypothetical protein